MRYSIRSLILALLAVCSSLGEDVFMRIDNIPGEVTRKGLEGQIEALAFSHEIVSPRDAASGLPTGKRQHQPIRVVMHQDKSTPLLFRALAQNTSIPTADLSFYRANPDGTQTRYMIYSFTGLRVQSVRPWMPNKTDQNATAYGSQVEVAFTYQTITWTYVQGGITFEDSWQAPTR